MYTFKKSLIAFVGMHCKRSIPALLIALAIVLLACTVSQATPTLPPGNTVQQWNTIAENTVVGSGTFQAEGINYMGYVSSAMYGRIRCSYSKATTPPGSRPGGFAALKRTSS